jgi:hypothetical protein
VYGGGLSQLENLREENGFLTGNHGRGGTLLFKLDPKTGLVTEYKTVTWMGDQPNGDRLYHNMVSGTFKKVGKVFEHASRFEAPDFKDKAPMVTRFTIEPIDPAMVEVPSSQWLIPGYSIIDTRHVPPVKWQAEELIKLKGDGPLTLQRLKKLSMTKAADTQNTEASPTGAIVEAPNVAQMPGAVDSVTSKGLPAPVWLLVGLLVMAALGSIMTKNTKRSR